MENYKKEKCSRQHLKIDVGQNQSQDIFMLANPMTYGDMTSPTSPHYGRTSRSNPNTPTNHAHQGSGAGGSFTRNVERGSLKNKGKNQSFFKMFGRNLSGGGSVAISKDEEEASSGSDHDDPFSPNSSTGAGTVSHSHRQMSEPPKSPPSAEHCTALSKPAGRHHSGGHSSRDSGFSSERESVSHLKDDSTFHPPVTEDIPVSPADVEEYHPAGMEALEILHNQLQLLVKCDGEEDTDSDSVSVYDQVIANLSKQLEDQSLSLDALRQSETNLKMSLKASQQRVVEAEMKLVYAAERCLQVERKYASLSARYKSLRRKHMDEEHPRHSQSDRRRHSSKVTRSPSSSLQSSYSSHQLPQQQQQHSQSQASDDASRIPPQRVQSQTLYDRRDKWEQNGTKRPNTAQGFRQDESNVVASISSLSHTETSV